MSFAERRTFAPTKNEALVRCVVQPWVFQEIRFRIGEANRFFAAAPGKKKKKNAWTDKK